MLQSVSPLYIHFDRLQDVTDIWCDFRIVAAFVEAILSAQKDAKQSAVDEHISAFLKHAPEKPGCPRYKVIQPVITLAFSGVINQTVCWNPLFLIAAFVLLLSLVSVAVKSFEPT